MTDDRLLVCGAEASLCIDVVGDELLLTAVDSFGEMQAPIKAADEARLREWLNKRANQSGERGCTESTTCSLAIGSEP